MKTKSVKPVVYLVVALMLATSVTYLVVAIEESSEISSSGSNNNDSTGGSPGSNDNSNEKSLSNTEAVETKTAAEGVGGERAELLSVQIETTLFAAASAGYLAVGLWILKKKENTKIPT